MIRAVTLDCAETLVRVRWAPGPFALDCATAVGLDIDPVSARATYERLVLFRWDEYRIINRTRDAELCVEWWRQLTQDWLAEIGAGIEWVQPIIEVSNRLLYHPPDTYFELFDDVRASLDALSDRNLRLGVLSNWDYSLHRVLAAHGLHQRFEHVIASLEEGVEKPDTELFAIALSRFRLAASEILHVGDNPLDDVQGAQESGFSAILLDRSTTEPTEVSIPDLRAIPDWIDRYSPG